MAYYLYDYIYVYGVVPSLCLAYAWIMWRILRSRVKELQNAFYKFFIYSGIAACLNLSTSVAKVSADEYLSDIAERDWIFKLIIYASHCFSLSHTIGKTLVIATRFYAICYPLNPDPWTNSRVHLSALFIFLTPAFLYLFMIPPSVIYRTDTSGYKVYIGVETWAQELSKVISVSSYLIFIAVSLPMCSVSIYQLRLAQKFNKQLVVQERALLIYTIIITSAHFLKCAQQIFWYITIITHNAHLFDLATRLYTVTTAATFYIPPLLLLTMSKRVRNEVSFGYFKSYRSSSGVSPGIYVSQTVQEATRNGGYNFDSIHSRNTH